MNFGFTCHNMEVRRHLAGVGSLLPPRESFLAIKLQNLELYFLYDMFVSNTPKKAFVENRSL